MKFEYSGLNILKCSKKYVPCIHSKNVKVYSITFSRFSHCDFENLIDHSVYSRYKFIVTN